MSVSVTPAQRHRFGLGFGVESGIVKRGDFEPISVPLWDLHLTARYENRNMAGGLRRPEAATTADVQTFLADQDLAGASDLGGMLTEAGLLLDAEGYVMEGSGENIFIVRDGVLYTPDLTSALDGITRKTVIELAQEMGYKVVEKRITRDEVYIADEAFFTGTAAEVTPIREVDGRPIGSGSRGPITEQLQARYFDLVHGRLGRHEDWLTLV